MSYYQVSMTVTHAFIVFPAKAGTHSWQSLTYLSAFWHKYANGFPPTRE
jgi:hypothetical protein